MIALSLFRIVAPLATLAGLTRLYPPWEDEAAT